MQTHSIFAAAPRVPSLVLTPESAQAAESGSETRNAFAASFDRAPFSFGHTLHLSDKFTLPALDALAIRRANTQNWFYLEGGATEAGAKWKPGSTELPVRQALERLEDDHLWIVLKRLQEDPEYAEVLRQCTEELSALVGFPMLDLYRDPVMTVLITSPGRITPCHCDGDANLLMQLSGSKTVFIANGDDRELLSDEALDRFWSGDTQPIQFTPLMQERAWRFVLEPGRGVSNPVIFPHWVENGREISISVSVNYKRREDHTSDVHKVNWKLRRLGLVPAAPGRSVLLDETKSALYRTAQRFKRRIDTWRHPFA